MHGNSQEKLTAPVLIAPAMRALDDLVTAVAAGDISVLILGETGTGKALFAEAVHRRSSRRARPLLQVNCAALSEAALEAELFAARGAAPGLIEGAHGGTLLLDEIGELSPALQAKLLRVFEARQVLRTDTAEARAVDVRVVSTSNRDLAAAVEQGHFRKDLYYRLGGSVIVLPPLRERRVEIEALASQLLAQAAAAQGREGPRVSPAALRTLEAHDWPGNVRELRSALERALLVCTGDELLPVHLHLPAAPAPTGEQEERRRIVEALRNCAGNQTRAARLLGISRGTLVSRLAMYALPRPRLREGA